MGEFGAVSVVSGNIRGQTNTLPLHIELLYHDYNSVGAFAAASILALLAVVTIIAKVLLERQGAGRRSASQHLHAPNCRSQAMNRSRLKNVAKTSSTFRAVRGVSLDIESGELVALLGPSGSGKTTILRMVAGLEYADEGQIFFGDEDATDIHRARARRRLRLPALRALPPHDRLRKHRLRHEGVREEAPKADIAARVGELLDLVQLDGLENRFPTQISGGQRQRVALARALAIEPRCCCSTSRSARSTPMCAANCAAGCAKSMTEPASPRCSSPMTRKRRSTLPTASW